jgi:transcriptional regulator
MDREDELSRQTTRQQMIALLSLHEHSARELSVALRIREKEVYDHLAHVRRSVVSQKKRLRIQPAQCLECRYVFRDRGRLTTPGKCPRCKGEHIQDPKYRVLQSTSTQ